MAIYNKLVRDKIPDIIKSTGKKYSLKQLNNKEYIQALQKKAFEELNEYINSNTNNEAFEELADLLEVIHAFAEYHGGSFEMVEDIRIKKLSERGGFKEKIFLLEVEN
ncbi:nucleoside triphosphate pyrophosphohydrolase [Bacillus sp. BRMEA1]|uniref:nucleoside triphosphate pyrophosphohydrolase n=1 Tax=Neobacillus endophyticus TaxID=2738405 RepID=UPI0015667FC7|nr:nucleoside triphosphate pyrophosphohydrolase [Neobacillus endophyticus]NRD79779.1 nucleoside triphosphate pyrophosphohydrolase [Neobacillus endophyticus]